MALPTTRAIDKAMIGGAELWTMAIDGSNPESFGTYYSATTGKPQTGKTEYSLGMLDDADFEVPQTIDNAGEYKNHMGETIAIDAGSPVLSIPINSLSFTESGILDYIRDAGVTTDAPYFIKIWKDKDVTPDAGGGTGSDAPYAFIFVPKAAFARSHTVTVKKSGVVTVSGLTLKAKTVDSFAESPNLFSIHIWDGSAYVQA